MTTPPAISTKRFVLRPLAGAEDVAQLRRWLADPRIGEALDHAARDIGEEGAREFLARFDGRNGFALAIRRRSDGARLGFYTLHLDSRHRTLSMTLAIGEEAMLDQAVAAETARAIVDWAFEQAGVEKIVAQVSERNQIVGKWLSTRMQLEGRLRDEVLSPVTGTRLTILRFGLLKSEWKAIREHSLARQKARGF